jgi:hypothetical protein
MKYQNKFQAVRILSMLILGTVSLTAFARTDGYMINVEGNAVDGSKVNYEFFSCIAPSKVELDYLCRVKELNDCRITSLTANHCNPRTLKCYC